MTRQIIYILFIAASLNCHSQETNEERQISVGIYGLGYPTKYKANIHAGGLFDISIKDSKRLYSSSSINYTGLYRYAYQFHNFSITSGLSWKLKKNHICFRPGIQFGYLYLNEESDSDYLFHGVFIRTSAELTYELKRFEYGIHLNYGIGYGPTRYYAYYEPLVQNKLGIMGAVGLQVKYNISR